MHILPCMSICFIAVVAILLTKVALGLCEIYLCADFAKLETSPEGHGRALDNMAWISCLCINTRIYLCRSHPHFQLYPFPHRLSLLCSIGYDPSWVVLAL